jgi:Ca-activated chloride channel homolog
VTHGDYAEENNAEVLGPKDHGQALHHPSQDSRPQGGDDAEEDDRTSQDSRPEGRSDEKAEDHSSQDSRSEGRSDEKAEDDAAQDHRPEVDREADNRPEEDLRPEEVHREEEDLQAEEHGPEVDRSSEHSTQENDPQEVLEALRTAAPIDKAPVRRNDGGLCLSGPRPPAPTSTRARVGT